MSMQVQQIVLASAACDHHALKMSLQGLQGEAGPKGDPGPYGKKGEKVRSKVLWLSKALTFLFGVYFLKLYALRFRETLGKMVNLDVLETMDPWALGYAK